MLKFRNLLLVALIACVAPILVGCNQTNDGYFPVSWVETTESSVTMALDSGKTYQIEYAVKPEHATNKDVTFASSDTDVATVDKNGVVTARKEGSTTIWVISADNKSKKAKVDIRVVASKQTLSTPVNLSYNSTTGSITWDKVVADKDFEPSYKVYINRDGTDLEFDAVINSFDNVLPGAYSVQVVALGNEIMYNDSLKSEVLTFTQLEKPTELELVATDNEESNTRDFALKFKMSKNTTSIADYEANLKRTSYVGNYSSLSAEDTALWEEAFNNSTIVEGYMYIPVPKNLSTTNMSVAFRTKTSNQDISNIIYGSAYSENLILEKLTAPTNIRLSVVNVGAEQQRQLTWASVNNAFQYKIVVVYTLKDGSKDTREIIVNASGSNSTFFNMADIVDAPEDATYEVVMYALGNPGAVGTKYLDSGSSLRALKQLNSVENISLQLNGESYTISWSEVQDADTYSVYISSNANADLTNDTKCFDLSGRELTLTFDQTYNNVLTGRSEPLWSVGDNFIKVVAKSGSGTDNDFSDSNVAVCERKLIKIATPEDFCVSYGLLKWSDVKNASKYVIDFGAGVTTTINDVLDAEDYTYEAKNEITRQNEEYSVTIKAYGDDKFIIPSQTSLPISVLRFGTITNLSVKDGALAWEMNNDKTGLETTNWVEVRITNANDELVAVVPDVNVSDNLKIAETLNELGNSDERTYKFSIRPISKLENGNALNGFYSDVISTYQIPTPTGLSVKDGVISWDRFSDPIISAQHSGLRYKIKLTSGNETLIITQDENNNELGVDATSAVLAEMEENINYNISLQLIISSEDSGTGETVVEGDTYILNSIFCAPISARLLAKPYDISVNDNSISWVGTNTEINKYNITAYRLKDSPSGKIRDTEVLSEDITPVNSQNPSFNFVSVLDENANFLAGAYEFVVRAIGNNGTSGALLTSKFSNSFEIYKLDTPTLRINGGALVWNPISYSLGNTTLPVNLYTITIENGLGEKFVFNVTDTKTYLEELPESWCNDGTDIDKALKVSIQARANNVSKVFDSEVSAPYVKEENQQVGEKNLVFKLPKITIQDVVITGDTVRWAPIDKGDIYYSLVLYNKNSLIGTVTDSLNITNYTIKDKNGGTYYIKLQQTAYSLYRDESFGENTYVGFIRSEYSDAINIMRFTEVIGQTLTINDTNQPILKWSMPTNSDNENSRFKIVLQKLNAEGSLTGSKYTYYCDYTTRSLDLFNTVAEYYDGETTTTRTLTNADAGTYNVFIQTVAKLGDDDQPIQIYQDEITGTEYLLMESKANNLSSSSSGIAYAFGFIIQQAPDISVSNGIIDLVNYNQNNKGIELTFTKLNLSGDELVDAGETPIKQILGMDISSYEPELDDGCYYKVETKALGNAGNLVDSCTVVSDWVLFKLNPLNANSITPTYANSAVSNARTFNGWYVNKGNLCWNEVHGVSSYKVYLTTTNTNNEISIAFNEEYASGSQTYEQYINDLGFGVYDLTFELVGGVFGETKQLAGRSVNIGYLNSERSQVIKVNKLFAPDYTYVGEYQISNINGGLSSIALNNSQAYAKIAEDGEFDFGVRDGSGNWVGTEGATEYRLTIGTSSGSSWDYTYSLSTEKNARFIASESLTNAGNYLATTYSIGNNWYGTNDSNNQVFLTSDAGTEFTIRYLGQIQDFKVAKGVLAWDSQNVASQNNINYDLTFETSSNAGDVDDLRLNTYSFDDDSYLFVKGDLITSIKVRYSGSPTISSNSATFGYVNSAWSAKMSNICKLPDIDTKVIGSESKLLYIDEEGYLAWLTPQLNEYVTQDAVDNLKFNISSVATDNYEPLTEPTIVSVDLNRKWYDVPAMASADEYDNLIYMIKTYIEGYQNEIQASADTGIIYLNSNKFEFNAPKLKSPVSLTLDEVNTSMQAVRLNWDISNSVVDFGGINVVGDILKFTYKLEGEVEYKTYKINADDYLLESDEGVREGQNPLWKLGNYVDISLNVLNSTGSAFSSTACPLNKTVSFKYFAGGDGTRTNPYKIASTDDYGNPTSYTTLQQLEMMYWLPEMYFEITEDIVLPDLEVGDMTNLPIPTKFNEINVVDYRYYSRMLTGGIYGNGKAIKNYKSIDTTYGMWNSIMGQEVPENEVDLNDTKFLNMNGVINGLTIEVDTIKVTNVIDTYNGIFVSNNYGLLYDCHTIGVDKIDEETVSDLPVFEGSLPTSSDKIYFGGLVGYNGVNKIENTIDGVTSTEVLYRGRVEKCTNTLNMAIFNKNIDDTIPTTDRPIYIGGIVGNNAMGYVIDCTNGKQGATAKNNGNLSAYAVGGIVAANIGGTIKMQADSPEETFYSYVSGCTNFGVINSRVQYSESISSLSGGIAGTVTYGHISFCINAGTISTDGKAAILGGIVGTLEGNGVYVFNTINVGEIVESTASSAVKGTLIGIASGCVYNSMYNTYNQLPSFGSTAASTSTDKIYSFDNISALDNSELTNATYGINETTFRIGDTTITSKIYNIDEKYAQFAKGESGTLPYVTWVEEI